MKKAAVVIAAILCVAVICVGYYFVKEYQAPKSEAQLTPVERIISQNLESDYPSSPRETVKLYNKILLAFHQEKYTAEELEKMCTVAYGLMDIELQGKNAFDNYVLAVQQEVKDYDSRKKEILQANVCNSNEVEYKTDSNNGDKVAFVSASYFVKEDGNYANTYQTYVLIKDEKDHWRIKTYYQTQAPRGE